MHASGEISGWSSGRFWTKNGAPGFDTTCGLIKCGTMLGCATATVTVVTMHEVINVLEIIMGYKLFRCETVCCASKKNVWSVSTATRIVLSWVIVWRKTKLWTVVNLMFTHMKNDWSWFQNSKMKWMIHTTDCKSIWSDLRFDLMILLIKLFCKSSDQKFVLKKLISYYLKNIFLDWYEKVSERAHPLKIKLYFWKLNTGYLKTC